MFVNKISTPFMWKYLQNLYLPGNITTMLAGLIMIYMIKMFHILMIGCWKISPNISNNWDKDFWQDYVEITNMAWELYILILLNFF